MLPVAFESEGSYQQICEMLAGVEAMPERIWVDEMRFTASQQDGQDERCALKLIVFTGNSEKSD